MLNTYLINTAWASAATSRHPDHPQHHQQPRHPSCTEDASHHRVAASPSEPSDATARLLYG